MTKSTPQAGVVELETLWVEVQLVRGRITKYKVDDFQTTSKYLKVLIGHW